MSSSGRPREVRKILAVTAVAAFLCVSAAAGFAVGSSQSTTDQEAAEAKRTARIAATAKAARSALKPATSIGLKRGEALGETRGSKVGTLSGQRAGQEKADSELAAIAEAEAEAAASALEYTDQLPNNQPGYLLPEDERTLGCVGYDATTGECVGD